MARVVESAGIPTVSLSVNRGYSERVRAPRAALIRYPYGSVFGRPFDAAGQTAVVVALLRVLETAREPGLIVDLPFRWEGDGA